MTATQITVGGAPPYEVVIGDGLLGYLPPLLAGATQVAVVHSSTPADRVAAAGRARG